MGDLKFQKKTGIVVIVRNSQRLHELNESYLHSIMDIFVKQSRYHLCFGHRLMLLLQFEDREIDLKPVGGQKPVWISRDPPDWAESLIRDRRIGLDAKE